MADINTSSDIPKANDDKSSQGCGHDLCCRGTERTPDFTEFGANDPHEVTNTAPKSNMSEKLENLGLQTLPSGTNEMSEDDNHKRVQLTETVSLSKTVESPDIKQVDIAEMAKLPEKPTVIEELKSSQLMADSQQTSKPDTLPEEDNYGKATPHQSVEAVISTKPDQISISGISQSVEQDKDITENTKNIDGATNQETIEAPTVINNASFPFETFNDQEVILPEGSKDSITEETESFQNDFQTNPEKQECIQESADEDIPELIPEYEIDQSNTSGTDCKQERKADKEQEPPLQTAPQSADAEDETDASQKEEVLLWAPLESSMPEQVEKAIVQKMESNNLLQQLMEESEQLLKDSADLFDEDEAHSDLYESDHEAVDEGNDDVGELESAIINEKTSNTSLQNSDSINADSDSMDSQSETDIEQQLIECSSESIHVKPVSKQGETSVVNTQPGPSSLSDIIYREEKSSKDEEPKPQKADGLSSSISHLSNVLSDGFKILQKIGYSPKPKVESKEEETTEVIEENSKQHDITDESKNDQQIPVEIQNGNHEENAENSQEQSEKSNNVPDNSGMSPSEILENSSHVISDSVSDALNESLALLKRFGISKDHDQKATGNDDNPRNPISREKAISFNDGLYKNYNLMLRLQRDVAKLQIHLANMKDCVRAIDKDLEDLMDATMDNN